MFLKTNTGQVFYTGSSKFDTQKPEEEKKDRRTEFKRESTLKESQGNQTVANVELKLWKVSEERPINYLACGPKHLIFISDGKAFAMGDNTYKQCGVKDVKKDFIDVPTSVLPKKDFVIAVCTEKSTFFVTATGTVFVAGTSKNGELGCHSNQTAYVVESPLQVLNLPRVSDIACGPTHSLAIAYDTGELYGWGNPQNSKLGVGPAIQSFVATPMQIQPYYGKLDQKPFFMMVACGSVFSLAIDQDGNLWYCGIKKFEPNSKLDEVPSFIKIEISRKKYFYIIASQEFALLQSTEYDITFIGDKSNVYSGSAEHLKQKEDKYSFNKVVKTVERPTKERTYKLSVNLSNLQLGIVNNGKIFVWGYAEKGRLGFTKEHLKGSSVVENPTELPISKKRLDGLTIPTTGRSEERRLQKALVPVFPIQLTLKNLPKTLVITSIYSEDNNLSNYFDNLSIKFVAPWRTIREVNYKYKIFLKTFLQILFKKGKERLKLGIAKGSQTINQYLKNIMLYQKIFGILYLQPYYICKLLVNPAYPEGEKIFKLIRDLHIRASTNSKKSLTYMISICLTLLKNDKYHIVENLSAPTLDMYSLKVYSLIILSNPLISEYFEQLKKVLLIEIIQYCRDKLGLNTIGNEPNKGGGFSRTITNLALNNLNGIGNESPLSPGGDIANEETENNLLLRGAFQKVL